MMMQTLDEGAVAELAEEDREFVTEIYNWWQDLPPHHRTQPLVLVASGEFLTRVRKVRREDKLAVKKVVDGEYGAIPAPLHQILKDYLAGQDDKETTVGRLTNAARRVIALLPRVLQAAA